MRAASVPSTEINFWYFLGNLTDIEAEKEAVRLRIWAKSVLKDSWLDLSTDQPIGKI